MAFSNWRSYVSHINHNDHLLHKLKYVPRLPESRQSITHLIGCHASIFVGSVQLYMCLIVIILAHCPNALQSLQSHFFFWYAAIFSIFYFEEEITEVLPCLIYVFITIPTITIIIIVSIIFTIILIFFLITIIMATFINIIAIPIIFHNHYLDFHQLCTHF